MRSHPRILAVVLLGVAGILLAEFILPAQTGMAIVEARPLEGEIETTAPADDTPAGLLATCDAPFIPVSQPLNDLGSAEYVRLEDGPTGYFGGLYGDGANARPDEHLAAGVALAQEVVPRNGGGSPDPANGKIVMISIGMSNTSSQFNQFILDAKQDEAVNPQLKIVNGAQPGMDVSQWLNANSNAWREVGQRLNQAGLTPRQVQVAWVKLAQRIEPERGPIEFPGEAQFLQAGLEKVARNLHTRFPNLKLAYFSSRTRAYVYWTGINPEPVAFETGFSVRWMIQRQIQGEATLNFDPSQGTVVAPYLSWGPYLWIDGLNPRSDGLTWEQSDLAQDCIHPSPSGIDKVAGQLLAYFKSDPTAAPWFLAEFGLPVAINNTYDSLDGASVSGNVIEDNTGQGTDTDGNGDPLSIESHTEPVTGTLTINLDGSFSYTPPAGFEGVVTFDYTVTDGQFTSNAARVTITMSSSPPVLPEKTYLPALFNSASR